MFFCFFSPQPVSLLFHYDRCTLLLHSQKITILIELLADNYLIFLVIVGLIVILAANLLFEVKTKMCIHYQIYCINRFTSLCKNLVNLLEFLAETFRCHVHHFQCLSKLTKFLHSEVNLLIQHIIVQDQDWQNNNIIRLLASDSSDEENNDGRGIHGSKQTNLLSHM